MTNSISIEEILDNCSSFAVEKAWRRIHVRRGIDPIGAISAANALFEATCKYILNELEEDYSDKEPLPSLYHKVITVLKVSLEGTSEQMFATLLSSCQPVIEGMATLKEHVDDNSEDAKYSKSRSIHHADLAVNFAGTISSYLIAVFEQSHMTESEDLI